MYKGKFNDCVEPLWEYMSTEVTVHGVVCVILRTQRHLSRNCTVK